MVWNEVFLSDNDDDDDNNYNDGGTDNDYENTYHNYRLRKKKNYKQQPQPIKPMHFLLSVGGGHSGPAGPNQGCS